MAVEKGKILLVLDKKLKGKSVSKTFKNECATKWASKIETDDDIEAFIEEREDIFEAVIKEADTRVTDALKLEKEKAKKQNSNTEEEEEEELPNDMPEWAKILVKQNKALETKITGFESKNNQTSLEQRFKADQRLKGMPEFILKRAIPKTEEEFEEAVTGLVDEYSQYATDNKLAALGQDKPTNTGGNGGGNGGGAGDGKVDETLLNFAKAKNEEAKTA